MSEHTTSVELNIAVVDDHSLVLEGLRSLLKRNGFHRIGLFRSAEALLDILRSHPYDVYILDVEMPDMDGYLLIDAIRGVWPEARIIVCTIHDELWTVRKLTALNVNAIVYKSLDMGYMVEAIHRVVAGEHYYCDEVAVAIGMLENDAEMPSAREMEVLQGIAQGLTSKEIAGRLFISENTVEAHRKSLYQKLKVRNLADLIMKSVKRGYLG